MTKIALIDTEQGSLSVQDLIEQGLVDLYPCKTFEDAEKASWQIIKKGAEYHAVVLDTLTTLATTTLNNITLDPSQELTTSIWAKRGALKITQSNWGEMSGYLIRLTRNLYSVPGRVFIICHEGERENPYDGMDMHAPDLNRMLLKDVYGMADAVVRLGKLPQAGDISGTKYPAGTRVLRLEDSPQYMAKLRAIPGHKTPALLPIPDGAGVNAVAIFDGVCNPPPKKVLLYGSPGSGKTTFACSIARNS